METHTMVVTGTLVEITGRETRRRGENHTVPVVGIRR
jgi:hypothetical protein